MEIMPIIQSWALKKVVLLADPMFLFLHTFLIVCHEWLTNTCHLSHDCGFCWLICLFIYFSAVWIKEKVSWKAACIGPRSNCSMMWKWCHVLHRYCSRVWCVWDPFLIKHFHGSSRFISPETWNEICYCHVGIFSLFLTPPIPPPSSSVEQK